MAGVSLHARVLADVFLEVALLFLASDPLLVAAHVEEALVGVLARRVVRVHLHLLVLLVKRLLDVPEHVVGELVEDFGAGRDGHGLVESAPQVGGVVVLLAFLERVEFAGQNLVPLLDVEASLLDSVEHNGANLSLILSLERAHTLDLVEGGA